MALLDVLVDAVVVVDGPGLVGGGAEQVLAVGYIRTGAACEAEDGRHDVGLLRHGIAHADGQPAGGVEEDDGHAEGAEGAVVGRLVVDVGVVGGDDEECVAVPWHLAGGVEEATEGLVGVADAGVEGVSLFVEGLAVALGHGEGMVRRGGEECGHEGLRHLIHDGGVVLHELFVPDGPGAVEVGVAAETAVGVIFRAAVVVLKARGAGKGLETHRAVLCTVEEGGGIAVVCQFARYAADVVERITCDEEGLDEHGYAGEDGGHAVDAFAPVGVGVAEGEAAGDE